MAEAPVVKEEGASPTPMEDDLYEDAGDLEFYSKDDQFAEQLYLCRLPRSTWKAWMKLTENLGDDDEVQIGTIRTWQDDQQQQKLRLLLNSSFGEHQLVPKEYTMDVTSQAANNHFVFCEQDTAAYKAKNKARQEAADAGIPAAVLRARSGESVEKKPFSRRQRYQPHYRKAIPKKTKIMGKVAHDVRVEPLDPREEERLLQQQMLDAEQSKTKLRIISRNNASSSVNPGTVGAGDWGQNFIKTGVAPKPKKSEVVKATRADRQVVLDWLFACFRQYRYWSMKALRQRTQQPEAWLRENLESIADLVKSGPFANHYTVKDHLLQQEEFASGAQEAAAEEAEDEEEDVEMEDVIPQ